MVAMFLCPDCQPEGKEMAFGLTAPAPRHCQGRNDHVVKGLLGGVACPCECNQRRQQNGSSTQGDQ